MITHRERQKLQQIRLQVYGAVPRVVCKGLCTAACGPLFMSMLEAKQIEAVSGKAPHVTEDGTCGHLVAGRCSVYEHRPTVCRMYGAADGQMVCPHGCEPQRRLTKPEATVLAATAEKLGGGRAVSIGGLEYLERRVAEMHGSD